MEEIKNVVKMSTTFSKLVATKIVVKTFQRLFKMIVRVL